MNYDSRYEDHIYDQGIEVVILLCGDDFLAPMLQRGSIYTYVVCIPTEDGGN